ncbi:MAG: hypothetical protein J5696_11335 [Lachnospiraceae bacterium]|nr:hypothetical protein [Lachnospiraceae bacterium]
MISLFEDQPIRTAWVEDEEEWYFSIVDAVGVLTEQTDYEKSRKYWNKLKQRLKEEGSQLVTNCHQLKTCKNAMQLHELVTDLLINDTSNDTETEKNDQHDRK